MADDIRTIDTVRTKGSLFVTRSELYTANILYLTRNGVGMVQLNSGLPSSEREFTFASGLGGYRIRFNSVAEQDENIHIIYKPGYLFSI